MFDHLTKTSIINFKEVTVDRINYIGCESNISITRQKYYVLSFNEPKPPRET